MNGYLKIKTSIDNSGVDKQIQQLENKLNDLKATLTMASEDKTLFSKSEILDMEVEVEKLSTRIDKLKQKQQSAGSAEWEKMKKSIVSSNNEILRTIQSVGRLALGVFAVESAYGFVSNAISTLSNENEQIAVNIEYIRSAIANALKPLIESIISLVFKLLSYINAISVAWFGVNLFANSSVEAFNKMKESSSKTAKSSKEIKKSLAGFDEMNVLADTSSTSAGAGGGATVSPSVDLSAIQNVEVPGWINAIIDFGKWVIENWTTVIGLLSLTKLVIDLLTGNWIGALIDFIVFIISQMPTLWNAIQVVWDGIVSFFSWLMEGIQNISETATKIVSDLIEFIVGLITYIFTHTEEVATNIGNFIGQFFQTLVNIVASGIQGIFNILVTIVSFVYNSIIVPILNFFGDLWNGIMNIFSGVANFFKSVFQSAWNGVKAVFSGVYSFFSGIFNTIKGIFTTIGTTIGNVVGDAFKTAINGALGLIEGILNTPIKAINGLLDVINSVPGINISKLNELKLPRLASGGIVNNPGHGVAVGGAIAGEAGREGVIPLTDPYAMQTLGREIGKWITVNNTSNTYLDGRLIKRSQDRLREELAFATNGGK